MSDFMDLLQRMMQSNMQLPKMQAPPIQGAPQFGSGKSLFDIAKQYQNGQGSGGALPGGNSLFGPTAGSSGDTGVDDMGVERPSESAAVSPAGGGSKGGAQAANSGASAGSGASKGGAAAAG